MPILSEDGRVVGIIDAESWKKAYFDDAKLLLICEVAYGLGKLPLFAS